MIQLAINQIVGTLFRLVEHLELEELLILSNNHTLDPQKSDILKNNINATIIMHSLSTEKSTLQSTSIERFNSFNFPLAACMTASSKKFPETTYNSLHFIHTCRLHVLFLYK